MINLFASVTNTKRSEMRKYEGQIILSSIFSMQIQDFEQWEDHQKNLLLWVKTNFKFEDVSSFQNYNTHSLAHCPKGNKIQL